MTTTRTAPPSQGAAAQPAPPATAAPATVALDGVTKTFRTPDGEVRAVRGIDLRVAPGEVVAFLGPNGAGKTTTLDMVLGLTEPTTGAVRVLGRHPRHAVREGRTAAVLQTGGLLRDLTVGETVRLVASTYPSPVAVDDVLERTGLTPLAGRLVAKCSGGEQQRLRFALALLPDPELLVLDEPTAGMDVTARREFWRTMHAEAARGRTVVFATHYLEEADAFADRIVVAAAGRVVADGSTADIRSRASGRTVRADLPVPGREAALRALRAHPGAADVRVQGDRVSVRATDADAVARTLLVDLGGHDLEIATGSLDEAFVALTSGTVGAEEVR
ncbi:ABC transporter ATP-binding protein [Nocardioides sp. ChNu-153]|uniref:ABC transporter ATP-binding protein n=1 Tax=Nocardioides sp. ChNu-153 TaxID=2779364 RepID=UPI0026520FF4|nr:ABC transporter ATP-binding protein [Nocardioides sp. ChNu-153]MDN7120388.1 ABC transporter ATP-binding protein [Nocardioides sp. ChNu-153]